MTLKLEVGKRYRTALGLTAEITVEDRHHWLRWGGLIDGAGNPNAADGLQWWDAGGVHHQTRGKNLISEIEPEPKKESPMVKMVARDEKPKEQVIEWWLEPGARLGSINLCARTAGHSFDTVIYITADGYLHRCRIKRGGKGLALDADGRIKVAAPECDD